MLGRGLLCHRARRPICGLAEHDSHPASEPAAEPRRFFFYPCIERSLNGSGADESAGDRFFDRPAPIKFQTYRARAAFALRLEARRFPFSSEPMEAAWALMLSASSVSL
jgi:hypothetical protein